MRMGKTPEWFQVWHFYWLFSERRRSKHGSERVKRTACVIYQFFPCCIFISVRTFSFFSLGAKSTRQFQGCLTECKAQGTLIAISAQIPFHWDETTPLINIWDYRHQLFSANQYFVNKPKNPTDHVKQPSLCLWHTVEYLWHTAKYSTQLERWKGHGISIRREDE